MPRTAEPRILPAVRDEVAGGIPPSWARTGSDCNTVPVANGGATLPLTANSSIGGGDHVALTLEGVTNTTKAGPLTEPARPRGGHS